MADKQEPLQGELFTHSQDDGQYKPHVRKNPFFMRFRRDFLIWKNKCTNDTYSFRRAPIAIAITFHISRQSIFFC